MRHETGTIRWRNQVHPPASRSCLDRIHVSLGAHAVSRTHGIPVTYRPHEQKLLRYDRHNSSEIGGFASPKQPTKCRGTRPAVMAWNLANSWTQTSSPPTDSAV